MTRLSVIIPTRNRPGPLATCLGALARSFPEDAETIVVSDTGDESLEGVVAPFVAPLRLRLVEVRAGGPGAARNCGLAVADGEIVAFTDDDCRPCPGWASLLAAGVRASPPTCVGGATVNGLEGDVYADATQLILCLLSRHDREIAGCERLLPSNNIAFPAAALRQIGGFDIAFRTAEDRELCRRWTAAGHHLAHAPEALVERDERVDFFGFAEKFYAYGKGAAQFHATADAPNSSLRESLAFHFRLPALLAPELRRRSFKRAAGIIALIAVWEVANLAGFIAGRPRLQEDRASRRAGAPETVK